MEIVKSVKIMPAGSAAKLAKARRFCASHRNRDSKFIAERFNANYPHHKGEFARVITFKTEYAQSLIDNFSAKDKAPHIAISVDMLDTGIDIPEVLNLVFFKLVRSKTKFWQMVGRGTRLCPDLFGPGQDKELFYLFDYCQNLDYFSLDIPATEGSVADSLGKRLFKSRLELIATLDHQPGSAELGAIAEAFPDLPLVGFFGNGEFAPIGRQNFFHNYTGALVLLTEGENG